MAIVIIIIIIIHAGIYLSKLIMKILEEGVNKEKVFKVIYIYIYIYIYSSFPAFVVDGIGKSQRYTNADLKISLYIRIHIKIMP